MSSILRRPVLVLVLIPVRAQSWPLPLPLLPLPIADEISVRLLPDWD